MPDLFDDTPIRLADAVRMFFPLGGMTPAGLRTEARKGRLELLRIAGKDFVTPASMKGMMEKCRAPGSRPGSSLPAILTEASDGSSGTGKSSSAQAALRLT